MKNVLFDIAEREIEKARAHHKRGHKKAAALSYLSAHRFVVRSVSQKAGQLEATIERELASLFEGKR